MLVVTKGTVLHDGVQYGTGEIIQNITREQSSRLIRLGVCKDLPGQVDSKARDAAAALNLNTDPAKMIQPPKKKMSSPFQDQMSVDIDKIFFNPNEYGEDHNIDGTDLISILDTDVSQSLNPSTERREGTYTDKLMLFVRQKDLKGEPTYDQMMVVDNVRYRIINVNLYSGVYEITLEAVA